MLLSGQAHTVAPGEGRTVDLGVIQMRVLAAGQATTNGAFTLAEFTGGPGLWTVPHIHRAMEESFYVLDGEFTFTAGGQQIPAGPGSYILMPRGTRHVQRDPARRRRQPAPGPDGSRRPGTDVLRTGRPAARQHHRPGSASRDLR